MKDQARLPEQLDKPPTGIDRLLLAGGIIGPLLFNVVYLIEGATRPGYDPWHMAMSVLSLGDRGWVQATNFIVFGILLAGFVIGLYRAMTPGVVATWVPLLLGLSALGLIIIGIFSQDPIVGYPPGTVVAPASTLHATVHLAGTIACFSALAISCLVAARRFAIEPRWRGWVAYSIATTVVGWLFLTFFGIAMANHGPAGLFERAASIVFTLWVTLLAVRLFMGVRFSHPNQVVTIQ